MRLPLSATRLKRGRTFTALRSRWSVLFLLPVLLALLLPARLAEAHAVLTQATPASGSSLPAAPAEIRLTFNERLERAEFRITVRNAQGEAVQAGPTDMSTDQRELIQSLPSSLPQGLYTVSYRVISEDGHPISESYVWSIGEMTEQQPAERQPTEESDHSLLHKVWLASRVLHEGAYLAVLGWVYWGLRRGEDKHPYRRAAFSAWLRGLIWLNIILTGLSGLCQLLNLAGDRSLDAFSGVLLHTAFGRTWLAAWLLSWLGLLLMRDSLPLAGRIGWWILLVAAKAFSGHAYASELPWLAVPMEGIHLAAAAVWTGGLLFLAATWATDRPDNTLQVRRMSRTFLWCFVLLAVSGALESGVLLRRLEDILYTPWGILLLIKTALALLVSAVAFLLRQKLKKEAFASFRTVLRADLLFAAAIVAIAALFSTYSPVPVSKPAAWSTPAGTVSISPGIPGRNDIRVKAPDGAVYKELVLVLLPSGSKEAAPLEIPLQLEDGGTFWTTSEGYLPFPGKWSVRLRAVDENGQEHLYEHQLRIF